MRGWRSGVNDGNGSRRGSGRFDGETGGAIDSGEGGRSGNLRESRKGDGGRRREISRRRFCRSGFEGGSGSVDDGRECGGRNSGRDGEGDLRGDGRE